MTTTIPHLDGHSIARAIDRAAETVKEDIFSALREAGVLSDGAPEVPTEPETPEVPEEQQTPETTPETTPEESTPSGEEPAPSPDPASEQTAPEPSTTEQVPVEAGPPSTEPNAG